MSSITEKQRGILRHALGTTHGGKPYRSHFVTGPDTTDFPDCVALTELGFMERRPGSAISGGYDVFIVTDAGREASK